MVHLPRIFERLNHSGLHLVDGQQIPEVLQDDLRDRLVVLLRVLPHLLEQPAFKPDVQVSVLHCLPGSPMLMPWMDRSVSPRPSM